MSHLERLSFRAGSPTRREDEITRTSARTSVTADDSARPFRKIHSHDSRVVCIRRVSRIATWLYGPLPDADRGSTQWLLRVALDLVVRRSLVDFAHLGFGFLASTNQLG